MDNQDEDDLKEFLERPQEGWMTEALADMGVESEKACCSLERNGFANIIMILNRIENGGPEFTNMRLTSFPVFFHIRYQAEVGLIFTDMHNAGLKPKWHEAIAEHERRIQEAKL